MNKTVKLTLCVDEKLQKAAKRLEKLLNFAVGEGITVTHVQGDRNGVTLKDGKAVIYHVREHLFYRELGVLVEHARKSDTFEIFEDSFFEEISTMIDTSRCGVPTVKSICEFLDCVAVMGYSTAMLYTEDTVTLEGRPYFGYMRGRYTEADLRAVDDYAFAYGIEVVPCLECYGHMEKYLIWKEARSIKDTSSVMLAREEATFQFVEQLIATMASCFRSRRVHIGMDEAWDMGRGAFLDKHGWVDPFDIFNEYMERLVAITDKYGLSPMMWSDMYFRVANKISNSYYLEETQIPDDVAAKIPSNMELVFWHYGEHPWCDDYMLKKHKALNRKTSYAGGNWGWIGHFPENHYAMATTRFSLEACRNNDVRSAMLTIWTNDNAECDLFANLLILSYFAELCFDKNASEEKLRARFEAVTGGDFDAFLLMSNYHNRFDNEAEFEGKKYSNRFFGKALFWQDVLDGLYDKALLERPMSAHYKESAEQMEKYAKANEGGRWQYLYDFAYLCFDYLAAKTGVAEKMLPAYKNGDKKALAELVSTDLDTLKRKTVAVHEAHKTMWMSNRNPIGFGNLDIRYAGVAARCETAKLLLTEYLEGNRACIEELDEARLDKPLSGFVHYSGVATPNLKT